MGGPGGAEAGEERGASCGGLGGKGEGRRGGGALPPHLRWPPPPTVVTNTIMMDASPEMAPPPTVVTNTIMMDAAMMILTSLSAFWSLKKLW